MIDGGKRCSCGAGHLTFGACMRAKNVRIGDIKGRPTNRQWDADLQAYKDARDSGIQPSGIDRPSVDRAVRISESSGEAFRG